MRPLLLLFGLLPICAFTLLLSQPTDQVAEASAQLSFDQITLDPNPPSGSGCCLDVLALGDIDGDGKVDAAVGSEHGGGWYWYRNAPNWPRHKIGEGDFTTDGRLVDINGDNRLDFVVSSISRDEVEWWENKGNPTQASGWARHTIGDRFAHDVVVGDVNGDTKPDVVMFRKNNPAGLVLFEQPADPQKPWTRKALAENFRGEGLAIGDVDGDNDQDIVASHYLFKNADGKGRGWERAELPSICTSGAKEDIRPAITDVNQDGKPDIVLGPAEECTGPVAWFEGPNWKRQEIAVGDSGELRGNHTLEVADFDGDGGTDLLLGEMHTGAKRVMIYHNLNRGTSWKRILLSNQGTHNARIADLNGDGKPDVVGKNYDGAKKLEAWLSRTIITSAPNITLMVNAKSPPLSLDKWSYKQVDDSRERLKGDFAFFGLAFGDVGRAGFSDIASGKYFYHNPGGNLMGNWARTTFPVNADAVAMTDVDDDGQPDVLALNLPKLYWLKPNAKAEHWTAKEVATGFEPTEHVNPQGYALAQIQAGGKPELVFTTGEGLWYVEIPANTNSPWPKVQITSEAVTEDVLAVGDIDRDGDMDVVGSLTPRGRDPMWFENPGDGKAGWAKHALGSTQLWADRSALEDLNGDGRPDLIITEENGQDAGAATYWFENPANPKTAWTRHLIATQGSTNSLSVVDMDGDGDNDVVTGEQRGKKRVVVWENQGSASRWIGHQVDAGKESHLGTRAVDLDKDGDLDLLSIAWDEAGKLHLWRNDAK